MKYENVTACVPALPDEIISAIEKSAGIKDLSFIIAVGPAEDNGEDKLIPLVSEKKRSSVEIKDVGIEPIPTKAILDASCITLVKYDGCHWLLTPPGVAMPC